MNDVRAIDRVGGKIARMHTRALSLLAPFAFIALFSLDAQAAPPEGSAEGSASSSDPWSNSGSGSGSSSAGAGSTGGRTGRGVSGAAGKRFRLHADTEFLGVSIFDPDGSGDAVGAAGFGVGRPNTVDGGRIGLGQIQQAPTYGFGFGYVFAQDRAIVGARASLIVNGTFDEAPDSAVDQSTTTVGGYIVPYFQWMFMPGNWARPYIEARLGFGGGATKVTTDAPGMDSEVTIHSISPNVGIGGGAHLFIIDAFSVDLGLNIDYFAPHGRATGDVPDDAEDWDEIGDLVTIGVLAGFSVWFD